MEDPRVIQGFSHGHSLVWIFLQQSEYEVDTFILFRLCVNVVDEIALPSRLILSDLFKVFQKMPPLLTRVGITDKGSSNGLVLVILSMSKIVNSNEVNEY
jgi:hypothetical protein